MKRFWKLVVRSLVPQPELRTSSGTVVLKKVQARYVALVSANTTRVASSPIRPGFVIDSQELRATSHLSSEQFREYVYNKK